MDKREILDFAKASFRTTVDALSLTADRIDDRFIDAINLIKEANKIVFTGVGKSGLVARKLSATFSSIGYPSVFLHPTEALHGDIGIVQNDDVVISISKSGNTKEIVEIYPHLKTRKVSTIAITGNSESYLNRESEVSLDASVSVESCPINLAPTTSTSVALALGDAIAIGLMKVDGFSEEDFSKFHPQGQIGRNVTLQVRDVMHKGTKLPQIRSDKFFRDAVIEITQKDLGCVCVITSSGILEGLLTDGDVRRILQKNDEIKGLKVADIMTVNPITINKEAFLAEALTVMENRKRQISVLPVVEEGLCVGIIRLHDILQTN